MGGYEVDRCNVWAGDESDCHIQRVSRDWLSVYGVDGFLGPLTFRHGVHV